MTDEDACDLRGLSVLVTRPRKQAEHLCEMIEASHGRPVRFPAMEIEPAEDGSPGGEILQQAGNADLLIFVSANAVEYAFPLLPDSLPLELGIAAVGEATAKKLRDSGLEPTLVPEERFDSEGLLALEGMQQFSGERIIIVRGVGGRQLLGDTLHKRGAQVSYAEVYHRTLPRRDARNLLAGWNNMVHVVIATSNQILDNLLELLGEQGREKLCSTPLVVVSERMAAHARDLGCRKLTIAANASDGAILSALRRLSDHPA